MEETGAEEETPVLRGTDENTDELAIELELGNRPDELGTMDEDAPVLRMIDELGAADERETPVLRGTEE
jgi:hypothetical protein